MWYDTFLQADGSSLLMILPLLICCLLPILMRSFQKPSQQSAVRTEEDVWFTSLGINKAFEKVETQVSRWKDEKPSMPKSRTKFSLFGGKPPPKRFTISESIAPRLLKINDPIEGSVSFEFTETEVGGTAIRISYYPLLQDRIQKMRTSFPLKIPFAAGTPCEACGKPILPEFNICPYCSHKIKRRG